MIVKRIGNPKAASSKASRTGCLIDYITADGHEAVNKTELIGVSGAFLTDSAQGQRAEMIALAEIAARSKDPVDHWILSWKEGEQPTHEQCRNAVETLKKHLGLGEDHLTVFALHRNTENYHLHIVMNRVDPVTLRVADKGWSIDRAHKAVAEIVRVQGWQPELNARYLEDDAELAIPPTRERAKSISTGAQDFENATGTISAERIAIEKAAPMLREARTWSEVHERLGQLGMRYEQKGSGALLWMGEIAVKASAIGREFSRKRMEERLGAYAADSRLSSCSRAGHEGATPAAVPPAKWAEYQEAMRHHREQKNAAMSAQRERHGAERERQLQKFRTERAELDRGAKWSGAGRNVAFSLLAAEHAMRRASLREKQKHERDKLRQQLGCQMTYEDFLLAQGEVLLAQDWRYRRSEDRADSLHGEGDAVPQQRDIRDFYARVQHSHGNRVLAVHYYRRNVPGRSSFTDFGKRIDVWPQQDDGAILAALQLAAEKWGTVSVTGTGEFKQLCATLAAQHGIRLSNPELNAQPSQNLPLPARATTVPSPASGSAYQRHKADILSRVAVRNPCQLDWMIGVRLRVTGHSQRAISEALEKHAPHGRDAEKRDWKNYADRTAQAVYGPRGDREYQSCKHRASAWIRVEGRESASRIIYREPRRILERE